MWSAWSELKWIESVKRKWERLPCEDQAVLIFAFNEAVAHPERVTGLKLKFFRFAPGEPYWTRYEFRIGHAHWVLIDAVKCFAPIDFRIDASIAIAAE
jgi:hypothetical protein